MAETPVPAPWAIRRMRASDGEAVTEIWLQMAREHQEYDAVAWSWSEDPGAVFRPWIVSCTMEPEMIALVAVDADDHPVGYVLARVASMPAVMRIQKKGEILDLALHSSWRGQGGGKALMRAAIDRLRRRGAEGLSLTVAAANASAIAFYERLGLRVTCHVMVGELGGAPELSCGSHTQE